MTNPKSFDRYAEGWRDLLMQWEEAPDKIVRIECANEKQARVMRFEFYKMREAALRDTELKERYADVLNSREVKVRENFCVFDTKDNNWISKLIRASIDKDLEAEFKAKQEGEKP